MQEHRTVWNINYGCGHLLEVRIPNVYLTGLGWFMVVDGVADLSHSCFRVVRLRQEEKRQQEESSKVKDRKRKREKYAERVSFWNSAVQQRTQESGYVCCFWTTLAVVKKNKNKKKLTLSSSVLRYLILDHALCCHSSAMNIS